ncbi:MAG: hypothetical protein AAF639_02250 [Chloroflexota bacterium]
MEKSETNQSIEVSYDQPADILTFTLTTPPRLGVAEETDDEVWIRFDPETNRILTIDVHHFSLRLHSAFGPSLTYTERTDPQRIEELANVFLPETTRLN